MDKVLDLQSRYFMGSRDTSIRDAEAFLCSFPSIFYIRVGNNKGPAKRQDVIASQQILHQTSNVKTSQHQKPHPYIPLQFLFRTSYILTPAPREPAASTLSIPPNHPRHQLQHGPPRKLHPQSNRRPDLRPNHAPRRARQQLNARHHLHLAPRRPDLRPNKRLSG